MIVGGVTAAIAVGYLFGLLQPVDVVAATNSQVASRVNPHLIDLVAAMATGAVGAFAQCREDVSDTLPGVAIAISLVPPLTVVGITMEAGAYGQSLGAVLLFLTNVAAILLTGVIVMAIFGVHTRSRLVAHRSLHRGRAIAVVVALVAVIAIPLGVATATLTNETINSSKIADVARAWARPANWTLVDVRRIEDSYDIVVSGGLPAPDTAQLRRDLDEAGLGAIAVTVRLVPEERVELPAQSSP